MKHTPEGGLMDQGGNGSQSYVLCNFCPFVEEMHALGGGGPCSGTAAWALLASMHMKTHNATHRKEGLWTKAGNESQSCVLCNVCPFFETMHALGGGGSCLGTAPKTGLVARATFYTLFALSLKRWTRSGVEARALLASIGRRACGATFYAMFAPSLKRCMHSGVGAHIRALQRGHCLQDT